MVPLVVLCHHISIRPVQQNTYRCQNRAKEENCLKGRRKGKRNGKRRWGSLENRTGGAHSLLELERSATGRTGRLCKAICKQSPYGYFHTNKTSATKEPFSGCIEQKCAPCPGYLPLTSMTPEWKIELIAPALFQLQPSVTMPRLITEVYQHCKDSVFSGVGENCREELVFTGHSAFVLLETHWHIITILPLRQKSSDSTFLSQKQTANNESVRRSNTVVNIRDEAYYLWSTMELFSRRHSSAESL